MNNPLKVSILAVALTTLGAGAALADSSQMYQQIADARRAAEQQRSNTPTVRRLRPRGAAFGQERVQRESPQPERRVEIRNNGRGQTYSVYLPAE